MTNLSPNLETQLVDASIGATPLAVGAAGFILPAQWGPINRVMSIGSVKLLREMYSNPVYNQSHISWAVIQKYLDYKVGGAKVCRIGKDDLTTKNAVKVFAADLTAKSWANGSQQIRKLNANDSIYPSSVKTVLKLTADPTVAWSVGDTIYDQSDSTITGELSGIFLAADHAGTEAYASLINVEGTFTDGATATNGTGTATIDTSGVTTTTLYDLDNVLQEVELSVTAGHEVLVGIGSVLVQSSASGTVVAKESGKIYLTDVTGTFTAADIDSVDGVTLSAAQVTVTAVDSSSSIDQVLAFYARYPGTVGNDISVAMCNKNDFGEAYTGTTTFGSLFEETSLSTDEVAIVVTLEGEVVENWIVSLDETATTSGGASKFIDTFLEENSNYILSVSKTSGTNSLSDIDDLAASSGHFTLTALAGGAVGTIELQEAKDGYDELMKKSSGCYMMGDFHELADMSNYSSMVSYVVPLADAADIVFVNTLRKDQINPSSFNVTTSISDITAISGKNFFPFYEWTYWKNTDIHKNYWIPVTGDNMALIMDTKNKYDWKAPAGVRRGVMKNIERLYYNLEEGDESPVSQLYKYGINANILKESAAGDIVYVMWGNRSKYNPASDLSRINVVQALLTDIKELQSRLEPYIFEEISEDTFALIRNDCDTNYLVSRATQAFTDVDDDGGYVFICDRSNNTAQTEKEKRIYIDFKVKYKGAAEYITLRVTVTSAGVSFDLV